MIDKEVVARQDEKDSIVQQFHVLKSFERSIGKRRVYYGPIRSLHSNNVSKTVDSPTSNDACPIRTQKN